jgi:LDH2 family malate/lactate/ureidoglycolate dehydrogenase
VKVDPGRLHRFITESLLSLEVPTEDAAIVADSFVEAELEGQSGHGAIRFPFVLSRLRAGLISPHPAMRIVHESPAAALLDGGNGLGPVVGMRALAIAEAKARSEGVGLCAGRRSNHLGSMGFYVNKAAAGGVIALGFGNTPPAMAPPGGTNPVLGTNPIAAAFPTRGAPVLVDLATSQVARGRILKAARAGEPIPAGWALDAEGKDTTDPDEAIKGSLKPLGGAKGFALALMVEALSGVLAGAAVGPDVGGTYINSDKESNLGLCFLVIDPAAIDAGFAERMTALTDVIRSVESLDAAEPVRVPGDRRRLESGVRRAEGIELSGQLINDLETAAGRKL